MLVNFFVRLSLNIKLYIMIILLELFFFYSILKSHVWSSIEIKRNQPKQKFRHSSLINRSYVHWHKVYFVKQVVKKGKTNLTRMICRLHCQKSSWKLIKYSWLYYGIIAWKTFPFFTTQKRLQRSWRGSWIQKITLGMSLFMVSFTLH